jgi:hypothetical protein
MKILIVTAADATHEQSLKNLLNSAFQLRVKMSIHVWDLGLSTSLIDWIQAKKDQYDISLFKYPFDEYDDRFNMSSNAGSYAWKSRCIYESSKCYTGILIWCDAGNLLQGNLWVTVILAKLLGIFVTSSKGCIYDWTHAITLRRLDDKGIYKEFMGRKKNASAAMIAMNTGNSFCIHILENWLKLCSDFEMISPHGSNRSNHRYDQAILSILLASSHYKPIFPRQLSRLVGFKIHQDVDDA